MHQNYVYKSLKNSSHMKFSKQYAIQLKHRFWKALCKALWKDKAMELFEKLYESHGDEEEDTNNETMSENIFPSTSNTYLIEGNCLVNFHVALKHAKRTKVTLKKTLSTQLILTILF